MLPSRLLLVDDHTLFRTGLRLILADCPAVAEILEAGSIAEAIERHAQQPIDLILLDIQMPGINGLDGVKLLKRHIPGARILVVSGSLDALSEKNARQLGIQGFVLKAADPSAVERAVIECLSDSGRIHNCGSGQPESMADAGLTSRQLEVLSLLCKGRSNKVIASELGLAENTVRVHVSAVLDQLGVKSRTEAVIAAQQRGLICL